jgi:nucleotide-binding universal stress UspA family protein
MTGVRAERGGRVVVGVDFSPLSAVALRWAAEEAALRGDRLEVVHGWQVTTEPRPEDAEPGAVPPLEAYARAATRRVERFVHDVLGRGPGPDLTVAAVHHPAAAALVRAARGADLLVVGSRGHGSVSALLLGSVSNECVRLAPCPVVVVRPVQDPDGIDPVGVDRTAATRSPAP